MDLLNEIKNNKTEIGVIGLGYVGLPLVIEFCKAWILTIKGSHRLCASCSS